MERAVEFRSPRSRQLLRRVLATLEGILCCGVAVAVLFFLGVEGATPRDLAFTLILVIAAPIVISIWLALFSPRATETIALDDDAISLDSYGKTTSIAWAELASVKASLGMTRQVKFKARGGGSFSISAWSFAPETWARLRNELAFRAPGVPVSF